MFKKIQAIKWHIIMPTLFFLGGFVWDALTIGKNVAASDLWIFAGYLLLATGLIYGISRPSFILLNLNKYPKLISESLQADLPYMAMQFLFGSLLSALFILYFKSASHITALVMSLAIGGLLIANEFLEKAYKRLTLSWTLLGLCAILFFNFAFPYVLGSIHPIWFYLSTVLGTLLVVAIYRKTESYHEASIIPVIIISVWLMLAYALDIIPPVPLVKQDFVMGYDIQKVGEDYQLTQQAAPKWEVWKKTTDTMQWHQGQKIVCFSSVFAPKGLETKLFHNWQFKSKKGWVTFSRIPFTLKGGRADGYRGYTYKYNLYAGEWRVRLETENDKTIAVKYFDLKSKNESPTFVKITF
jgi:hypothetical protein